MRPHAHFAAGSSIQEHQHPNEEIWTVIDSELEATIDGARPESPPPAP